MAMAVNAKADESMTSGQSLNCATCLNWLEPALCMQHLATAWSIPWHNRLPAMVINRGQGECTPTGHRVHIKHTANH